MIRNPCFTCEHDLDEHECTGEDDAGNEIWECRAKGCRCEQLEVPVQGGAV